VFLQAKGTVALALAHLGHLGQSALSLAMEKVVVRAADLVVVHLVRVERTDIGRE